MYEHEYNIIVYIIVQMRIISIFHHGTIVSTVETGALLQ
jgi:hypothetical protein